MHPCKLNEITQVKTLSASVVTMKLVLEYWRAYNIYGGEPLNEKASQLLSWLNHYAYTLNTTVQLYCSPHMR